MKKTITLFLAALALVALAASCSKEPVAPADEIVEQPAAPASGQITISASLADAYTRVDFSQDTDDYGNPYLVLKWANGDYLIVTSATNQTSIFEIIPDSIDSDGKTADFSGTLPEGGAPYTVSMGDIGSDGSVRQFADEDLAHLQYSAIAENVSDITNVSLTTLSGVLGIVAKLPDGVAGKIGSIDLVASEPVFFGGLGHLTIELGQKGDVNEDNILNLSFSLPATEIPAGTTLFLRFHAPGENHDVYTRYHEFTSAVTLPAGKFNVLKFDCTKSDVHAGKRTCTGASADDPYLIADKYQLQAIDELASSSKKYFKLVDNIDLDGSSWTSLNSAGTKVVDLNGSNKTISHLSNSLFDDLNGSVDNLKIENADVNGGSVKTGILANTIKTAASSVSNVTISNSKVQASAYTGGLVGDITKGKTTISNVHLVNTDVTGTLTGGIIGFTEAETELTGSSFTGNGTASAEATKGIITASGPYAGALVAATTANVTTTVDGCSVLAAKLSSAYHRLAGAVGFLRLGSIVKNSNVGEDGNPVVLIASGTAAQRTAGFIGEMSGGEVKDCKAYVKVTGVNAQIGGFIGHMTGGTVTGCKSFGEVSGPSRIGGFFGEVTAATTISNNESNCQVTASSTYVGGFVGRLAGSVSCSKCYHKSGKVSSNIGGSAESFVGGFAGYIGNKDEPLTGIISSCFVNNADVESVKYNGSAAESSGKWVGGFAGGIGSSTYAENTGLVEKCGVYTGKKAGGQYTGGFAGVSYVKIEKCRVNGTPTITGYASAVGGFVGYQQGNSVKYCYTNAVVRHANKSNIGGFIGDARSTSVEECYSSGNINNTSSSSTNQSTNGGMIGRNTSSTFNKLIRWNDSNSTSIVGGEASVPGGCHVKAVEDTDFSSVATELGWSTDGTIWNYPSDGKIPTLIGV